MSAHLATPSSPPPTAVAKKDRGSLAPTDSGLPRQICVASIASQHPVTGWSCLLLGNGDFISVATSPSLYSYLSPLSPLCCGGLSPVSLQEPVLGIPFSFKRSQTLKKKNTNVLTCQQANLVCLLKFKNKTKSRLSPFTVLLLREPGPGVKVTRRYLRRVLQQMRAVQLRIVILPEAHL